MFGKLLAGVVGSVILLLGFNAVEARELEMRPFLYTQGFEEVDPVKFWITNGKYTINFKGLTREKSFSGRKSFKLDVTFKKGSFFYWSIPVMVPAEGRLKYSARIFLGGETTGRAGLGVNVVFPPTTHSGCRPLGYGKKGEWRLIKEDLVKYGENAAKGIMPRFVWGATAENAGVYVNRIVLFLLGKPGERVVVYVDDIKIEGEVPAEGAYREEIKRRWAPVKEKFEEKILSWEKILRKSGEEMTSLADLSEEAEKLKRGVETKRFSLRTKVEKIKKRGWIEPGEQKEIDPSLRQLEGAIRNIKLLSEERTETQDMLLRVVSPISSLKILPFDTFVRGEISDEIRVIATPGEYESASFVVSALTDIDSLKVEATDLQGKKAVIPSENIEIKIVKCWFQAASAWVGIKQAGKERILVPELLLNDASLIKVDYEREENYLRLSFPEGERYIWISNPAEPKEHRQVLSIEEFPVKDSPYLLPVNIPAGRNQQFWVTVKVPASAEAGVYTGNIALSTEEETLATLTLELRVLPFKLASPKTNHNLEQDFVSSIYYRARLHPDFPKGSISSEWKSKEQLRAELKNMFAHGITNPNVYQGYQLFDERLLKKYLKIREEVGMGGQPLYYLGVGANASPSQIKRVLTLVKPFGIEEVYFHGIDEARGDKLKAQREAWIATRKAGGRIFVASYVPGNFEAMGDIQDLLISAFLPSKEKAAQWHSLGHKIFSYENPQAGVENPEIYRRNFGLFLWKHNYDGAMTYAYQDSFGNIWNDFDHPRFRDHNFTYPTVNGVITTIALAGYREGMDDIRYATTLRLAIEEAKKSRDKKIRALAAEAEKYLEELDTDRDLDAIRLEIIDYILRLKGKK